MSSSTEKVRANKRGLSVSAKISLGFSIVLALHISIAVLGHYGLSKAKNDLERYNALREQVEKFDEIDRVVSALQRNVLLFAFTGYEGPEVRATQLQGELEDLLRQTEALADREGEMEAIRAMQQHLEAHREIFEAVVVDRAKRRDLVNVELRQLGRDFEQGIELLAANCHSSEETTAVDAAFHAAQLDTVRFVNDPDSMHVRGAKLHLSETKALLNSISCNGEPEVAALVQNALVAVEGYETAVIQMVQATRGYLHLVNVVLAGESEEFRRVAAEVRTQQSTRVSELAETMADDSQRFQFASNVFSVITIILGVLAAWLIGRDVAPPLNAITSTFDGLASGKPCETIPALDRRDELGRLAAAAQIFKDKAAETERLLRVAETSQAELNELNRRLETQTKLAESMAQEATAATLAKSEFLANMSHEIRTPMTAILGFAETIADSVDDPETSASIDTIKRNGEHLLAIINDILDLSKVEAGKMSVESVNQSPFDLVNEVAELVKVKADGAGLPLVTKYVGPIPATIKTDPTRLRQILINLVGNAIKFTEVGSVKLITSCIPEADQGVLQFDIVDTGIGMTQDQISRLFQPFSQADSSTTRRFGGTGLGLTISKRFAEILGGDLTLVETKRDVGTHFRVRVATGSLEGVEMVTNPQSSQAAGRSKKKREGKDSLKGCRILLAEDGPDNQRLLSFVLKRSGAEVCIEENGQLATDAALAAEESGAPFDCILMDMQMPVMGGYEATQLLRGRGYEGPILALTAHAMDGDRQKCLSAGCDDYLTKPIDKSAFVSTIAKWAKQNKDEDIPSTVPQFEI